MTYQLPRSVFDLLLEAFNNDKPKAELFAKAFEESIQAIDAKAVEVIVEKKEFIKLELKEELKKELVTNETLINVKQELEFKIDKVNLLMKILIGLQIIGLTMLNPAFTEIIKSFLK